MNRNSLLVEQMREAFRCGSSVADLIKTMEATLGRMSAIETISYFIEAFDLTTKESIDIMSYSFFGGGDLDDQDLDRLLRPRVESKRHLWDSN